MPPQLQVSDRPPVTLDIPAGALERRGRWWVFGSFLLCPCHLPLTLGVLATVFGGTALGALLRSHVWVASAAISLAWVGGTAYGFRLLRRAQRGATCATRGPTSVT